MVAAQVEGNRRRLSNAFLFGVSAILFLAVSVAVALVPTGDNGLEWMGVAIAVVMTAVSALLAASAWHSEHMFDRRGERRDKPDQPAR